MSDPKSIQLKFVEWLSSKVSAAKLSELYIVCNDIESFCLERKILSHKLFETTNPEEIKRVISTIELRFSYKSNFNKMSSVLRYYYNFLKEYSESTQHKKTNDNLQKNVILSTEHITESQQKLTGEIQPKDNNKIDFNIKQDLTFTKPISFSYFGEEETVNNWTKLYTGVVAYLLDDYPHVLKKYLNRNIRGRGRYDFSDEDNMRLMSAPKKVADNFYLETNLSATDIISKIKQLLNICNVDYENLLICFIYAKHKNEIKVPTPKTNVNCKPYIDIAVKYFPRGYRVNSSLEYKRFSRYYEKDTGHEIQL